MRRLYVRRFLFIASVALTGLALLPSARAQGPGGQRAVFLPLAWRGAALADLPRPSTAVPTAAATRIATGAATPSPAPTSTATVAPPTATLPIGTLPPRETAVPTPTETAAPEPSGKIFGYLKVDGAPAPVGLGADPGPGLFLRRCDGGDCTFVARTGTLDEQGRYEFDKPAPLAAGAYYQVAWQNEINEQTGVFGDDLWLGAWYGPRIVGYTGSETLSGGDMELADLVLTAPSHGSGLTGLPWTFEWKARRVEVGNYKYSICECCNFLAQREKAWQTQSLGRATAWTMNQYPPNVRPGASYRYCWFVTIVADKGAYAESFHERMHWFIQGAVADRVDGISAVYWWDRLAAFARGERGAGGAGDRGAAGTAPGMPQRGRISQ